MKKTTDIVIHLNIPQYRNSFMILVVIICLLLSSAASASGIVAVQSINIKPYNEVLKGFEKACDCSVNHFVISEMRKKEIRNKIKKAKPDLILTIGFDALNMIKDFNRFPTIYTMVLNPQNAISGKTDITGISMSISPDIQLRTLSEGLPEVKNIGLLYDPERTGHFVEKARLAAASMGIKLIAKEVRSPRNVPELLKSMSKEINAFWMLPDLIVAIPETIEFMLLFSIQNRVPLITFSEKYVEMGAFMSLDLVTYDIGIQAGEMAKEFFSGTDIKEIKVTDARKSAVTINMNTVKKLGITINRELLERADKIIRE